MPVLLLAPRLFNLLNFFMVRNLKEFLVGCVIPLY